MESDYNVYYDRSLDGKKVGHIEMRKLKNQEELGSVEFFDDSGNSIFKMEGSNEKDDEVMRCDIANDETLAGFDWYHNRSAMRGVSFIIIKEKTVKKIIKPHLSAAFDMITKMLCEKYQIPSEKW
jgi:hypothetical protein